MCSIDYTQQQSTELDNRMRATKHANQLSLSLPPPLCHSPCHLGKQEDRLEVGVHHFGKLLGGVNQRGFPYVGPHVVHKNIQLSAKQGVGLAIR